MKDLLTASLALALVSLPACSKSDKAPAEQIGEAAEDLVKDAAEIVDETPPQGPFAPRDECAGIAGSGEFRERLSSAIASRDADALVSLAAPGVKLDFGGGAGQQELRSRLGDPEAGLWKELDEIMRLGCAPGAGDGIVMPGFFAADIGKVDAYRAMIVTDNDVPVTQESNDRSPTVATLSWDIVEIKGAIKPDEAYQLVETAGGKTGYVASDRLRSYLDYRLLAQPLDGNWRVTAFIAGD